MTIRIRRLAPLLAGLAFAAPALAENASERSGAFSLASHGIRAIGMGGAMTGLADDAAANFWNPAGLVNAGKGEFQASYALLYGIKNLSSQYIAVAQGDPARGGFGASFMRVSARIGEDKPTAWLEQEIQIGLARTLQGKDKGVRITAGASARLLGVGSDFSTGKARGYALDGGVFANVTNELALGARLRNWYSSVRWDTQLTETIPFAWAAGASYRATKGFVLAADLESNQDSPLKGLRAGAEYWLSDDAKGLYKQLRNVALRAGAVVNLAAGGTAITAGATLRALVSGTLAGLDYAFVFDRESVGNAHRIGISARL